MRQLKIVSKRLVTECYYYNYYNFVLHTKKKKNLMRFTGLNRNWQIVSNQLEAAIFCLCHEHTAYESRNRLIILWGQPYIIMVT